MGVDSVALSRGIYSGELDGVEQAPRRLMQDLRVVARVQAVPTLVGM